MSIETQTMTEESNMVYLRKTPLSNDPQKLSVAKVRASPAGCIDSHSSTLYRLSAIEIRRPSWARQRHWYPCVGILVLCRNQLTRANNKRVSGRLKPKTTYIRITRLLERRNRVTVRVPVPHCCIETWRGTGRANSGLDPPLPYQPIESRAHDEAD